jgi:hypothetical protein
MPWADDPADTASTEAAAGWVGGEDLRLANNEQLEGRLIALEFMLQGFMTVTANGAGHVAATRIFWPFEKPGHK